MAVIYEATVQMSAGGQGINNILYYEAAGTPEIPWDPATALALAEDVRDAWITNGMPSLTSTTTLTGVAVRALNQLREVISTFTQNVSASTVGSVVASVDTPATVAIIGFQLIAAGLPEFPRVPKRSYIALGPISSNWIADNGVVTIPVANRDLLTALLTQGHAPNATPMNAVRLGTPNELGQPSLGVISGVLYRPFASFRRSRLTPPTGEGT